MLIYSELLDKESYMILIKRYFKRNYERIK